MASLPTLDCSVCMNAFSSTERATVPYVYTCGHSCCFSCTEALKNPSQQASYRACPECKEKWATDPRKNFGLIRSLELQATQVRSSVERAPARQTTRHQIQAAASRSANTVQQPSTPQVWKDPIQQIRANRAIRDLFRTYGKDVREIHSIATEMGEDMRLWLHLKDVNDDTIISTADHQDAELNAIINSLLDGSIHRSNHVAKTSGKRNARFMKLVEQMQEDRAAQQERCDMLMAIYLSLLGNRNW